MLKTQNKKYVFKNYCRPILTNEAETWVWTMADIN
jgi:hypothetical protein